MAKVRRIDWSPSEWLAGTRGIGLDETAVYITVLNIIYDRADACPNDAVFIAGQMVSSDIRSRQAQAGMTKRTSRALGRLISLGKLHVTADGQGLTNGRAERELNKAHERMRGTVKAGIASGLVRTLNARSTTVQRQFNDTSMGSELSNINNLTRTSVRIIQPSTIKDHNREISTDAARDPARDAGATGRAQAGSGTMKERMAALAALNRRKFLA